MTTGDNQLSTTPLICKCCCEVVSGKDRFCQHCGFPLTETEERQQRFINNRGYNKEQLKKLDSQVEYAGITLYILAGLLLLAGLVLFFLNTKNDAGAIYLITDGILAILFFCLGVLSYKHPVTAIICGLILYIVVSIVFSNSILISVIIIIALSRALINALKAQSIRKQHNI